MGLSEAWERLRREQGMIFRCLGFSPGIPSCHRITPQHPARVPSLSSPPKATGCHCREQTSCPVLGSEAELLFWKETNGVPGKWIDFPKDSCFSQVIPHTLCGRVLETSFHNFLADTRAADGNPIRVGQSPKQAGILLHLLQISSSLTRLPGQPGP